MPAYVEVCSYMRLSIYYIARYVALCVGRTKETIGMHLQCISKKRDTNKCILGKLCTYVAT